MAKIRGFTLENIDSIKIAFSTFDGRVGPIRYVCHCANLMIFLKVSWLCV